MKKPLRISAAFCTLALAYTTASMAQGKQAGADRNGDGAITLEEMQAKSAEHFERMDLDGNGVIDAADRKARQAQYFTKADRDGDGEISQDELRLAHEARRAEHAEKRARFAQRRAKKQAELFAKFDQDGSGGLNAEELRNMHEARQEHRAERRKKGASGRRGGFGHHALHMLKKADSNGDSAVTRAEFDAAIAARFARMDGDGDGDGSISQEERDAARNAHGRRYGK